VWSARRCASLRVAARRCASLRVVKNANSDSIVCAKKVACVVNDAELRLAWLTPKILVLSGVVF